MKENNKDSIHAYSQSGSGSSSYVSKQMARQASFLDVVSHPLYFPLAEFRLIHIYVLLDFGIEYHTILMIRIDQLWNQIDQQRIFDR